MLRIELVSHVKIRTSFIPTTKKRSRAAKAVTFDKIRGRVPCDAVLARQFETDTLTTSGRNHKDCDLANSPFLFRHTVDIKIFVKSFEVFWPCKRCAFCHKKTDAALVPIYYCCLRPSPKRVCAYGYLPKVGRSAFLSIPEHASF